MIRKIAAQKNNLQANYIACTNLHVLSHAFSQKLRDVLALITGVQVINGSWRCQVIASSISTHIRGSSWSEDDKQKYCTFSTEQFTG